MTFLLFACATSLPDATTTPPGPELTVPAVATITVPASFLQAGSWEMPEDGLFQLGFEFYQKYPDDYDFLVFFSEEPFADLFAYAVPVDLEIDGIGLQEVMALYGWDSFTPAIAGSAGQLQHLVFANDPTTYPAAALWDVQDVLVHEVAHRWGADLSLDAPDPWVLVDRFWSHWNVHANVGGPSALGYGELVDGGDGTFAFVTQDELKYSTLELYQQGLLPRDEVGELFYVTGTADYEPSDCFGTPWSNDCVAVASTFSGTRTSFTVDDIVARQGPRVPAFDDAQKAFRMAFVLVCADEDACDPHVYTWVDEQRAAFVDTYAYATGGRGAIDTTL